jgi:membrane associated rhomboid family serine protease
LFVSNLAGSLAHSLTDHNVALAGASGGCYALIGAHLASVVVVSIYRKILQVLNNG